jgi:hypothetical protein
MCHRGLPGVLLGRLVGPALAELSLPHVRGRRALGTPLRDVAHRSLHPRVSGRCRITLGAAVPASDAVVAALALAPSRASVSAPSNCRTEPSSDPRTAPVCILVVPGSGEYGHSRTLRCESPRQAISAGSAAQRRTRRAHLRASDGHSRSDESHHVPRDLLSRDDSGLPHPMGTAMTTASRAAAVGTVVSCV